MGRASYLRDRFVKIHIVTPESPGCTLGNAVTANRWAGILRRLGHDVTTALQWTPGVDNVPDVLVGLHARRSHPSIERFRRTHPTRPLIVALTGTDLYKDLPEGNPEAQQSLELATRIVGLQEAAGEGLPERIRPKLSVIYQSAVAPVNSRRARDDCFEVCVLSHLRDVKDPLIAALAVRHLESATSIRLVHAGRALSSDWEARAREEESLNPRYMWLGDQSHDDAMQLLSGSRLLVLSSLMEGGASVIAEAVVCGVPVLCTKIPGNIGMLGRDYLGYFKPRDSGELRERLRLIENEPRMWERLHQQVLALQPRFSPETESQAWSRLLYEL
jgi:putative glycosyltransferase (TIGR04348 family)